MEYCLCPLPTEVWVTVAALATLLGATAEHADEAGLSIWELDGDPRHLIATCKCHNGLGWLGGGLLIDVKNPALPLEVGEPQRLEVEVCMGNTGDALHLPPAVEAQTLKLHIS